MKLSHVSPLVFSLRLLETGIHCFFYHSNLISKYFTPEMQRVTGNELLGQKTRATLGQKLLH